MTERDDYVYTAKLAELTERYDEMAKTMVKLINLDIELTDEERNLLSVAYKNRIVPRRGALRVISAVEKDDKTKDCENKLKIIKQHRLQCEAELNEICQEVLHNLKHLIPKASTDEAKVFYLKMKGDYHRYLAEFATGEDRKKIAESSFDAYSDASDIAKETLSATNPVRLLLAMNFSVLLYEIMDHQECACDRAKEAVDDAMTNLDTLKGEDYDHCNVILEMMRDNLTLWESEQENNDEGVERDKASRKSDVGITQKKT